MIQPLAVVAAGVVGWVVHKYMSSGETKVISIAEGFLGKEIVRLSPAEKSVILDIDKWIQSLQPVVDSKVVAAVAAIIAKFPELAPASSLVTEILEAVVSTAEKIVADEQKNLQ